MHFFNCCCYYFYVVITCFVSNTFYILHVTQTCKNRERTQREREERERRETEEERLGEGVKR